MAWAPPVRKTSSTPAIAAAARTAVGRPPSAAGGVQTTSSLTPASRAGMAVISTVEG